MPWRDWAADDRVQDALAYLRKEVAAMDDAIKASAKNTKAAQESARSGFDGNVPMLKCWQDVLASVETFNQKQGSLVASALADIKDTSKEVDQARKAVRPATRTDVRCLLPSFCAPDVCAHACTRAHTRPGRAGVGAPQLKTDRDKLVRSLKDAHAAEYKVRGRARRHVRARSEPRC